MIQNFKAKTMYEHNSLYSQVMVSRQLWIYSLLKWNEKGVTVYRPPISLSGLTAGFMRARHVKAITPAASVVTVPIRFRLAWLHNHFQEFRVASFMSVI